MTGTPVASFECTEGSKIGLRHAANVFWTGVIYMSASLIGSSGSSTFTPSTAAVLMSLAGSRFSSGIGTNARIRRGGFVNQFSPLELNPRTMFFAPGPKIVFATLAANIGHRLRLLDHLIGGGEWCLWDTETERLGGLEIDDKLEFGRLLDRDITGLRPAQNLVDKIGNAPEQIRIVWSLEDETSLSDL